MKQHKPRETGARCWVMDARWFVTYLAMRFSCTRGVSGYLGMKFSCARARGDRYHDAHRVMRDKNGRWVPDG